MNERVHHSPEQARLREVMIAQRFLSEASLFLVPTRNELDIDFDNQQRQFAHSFVTVQGELDRVRGRASLIDIEILSKQMELELDDLHQREGTQPKRRRRAREKSDDTVFKRPPTVNSENARTTREVVRQLKDDPFHSADFKAEDADLVVGSLSSLTSKLEELEELEKEERRRAQARKDQEARKRSEQLGRVAGFSRRAVVFGGAGLLVAAVAIGGAEIIYQNFFSPEVRKAQEEYDRTHILTDKPSIASETGWTVQFVKPEEGVTYRKTSGSNATYDVTSSNSNTGHTYPIDFQKDHTPFITHDEGLATSIYLDDYTRADGKHTVRFNVIRAMQSNDERPNNDEKLLPLDSHDDISSSIVLFRNPSTGKERYVRFKYYDNKQYESFEMDVLEKVVS